MIAKLFSPSFDNKKEGLISANDVPEPVDGVLAGGGFRAVVQRTVEPKIRNHDF